MPDESSAGTRTLNALFISLDKNLLDEQQGDVKERHLRYAKDFNQLNIIVFTKRSDGFSVPQYLAKNIQVFPTNSSSRWMFVTDALKIARNIRKQQRVDVVSTQDPFITAIVGIVVKFSSGAHLNIQIHNDYGSKYWKNESLQNRVFSLMLPITLRLADSVRAVSRLTARSAPNPNNVFIAPIAIDTKFFKPQEIKKNFDIICVARLDQQKNIPLLIKVLTKVKKSYPHIRAVIAGGGPEREIIEQEIMREGLEKTITLVGRVGREKIRSLLAQSRIFVLPSNYEGWGLAAIEAAACGLPVIMTDTGGACEIVENGKTGHIIPVGKKPQFIEKVMALLENLEKAENMGMLGRKRVEKLGRQYKNTFIEQLVRRTSQKREKWTA